MRKLIVIILLLSVALGIHSEDQTQAQTFESSGQIFIDWSPDGQEIAYRELADNDTYIIDIDTQAIQRVGHVVGIDTQVLDVSWSPDGQWIVVASTDDDQAGFNTDLWLYDTQNNDLSELATATNVVTMSWSPDSQHFGFVALDELVADSGAWYLNIQTKTLLQVATSTQRLKLRWSPTSDYLAILPDPMVSASDDVIQLFDVITNNIELIIPPEDTTDLRWNNPKSFIIGGQEQDDKGMAYLAGFWQYDLLSGTFIETVPVTNTRPFFIGDFQIANNTLAAVGISDSALVLWSINMQNGQSSLIDFTNDGNILLSQNGNTIWFTDDVSLDGNLCGVYSLNVDSGIITDLVTVQCIYSDITASPTEQTLAISVLGWAPDGSQDRIYLMNRDGSNLRPLIPEN